MFKMAPHAHTPNEWFYNFRSMWRSRGHMQWHNPVRAYTARHWLGLAGLAFWGCLQFVLAGWLGLLYVPIWIMLIMGFAKRSIGPAGLWTWWPVFVGSSVWVNADHRADVFEWLTHNVPRNMWVNANDSRSDSGKARFVLMNRDHAIMFKLMFGGK